MFRKLAKILFDEEEVIIEEEEFELKQDKPKLTEVPVIKAEPKKEKEVFFEEVSLEPIEEIVTKENHNHEHNDKKRIQVINVDPNDDLDLKEIKPKKSSIRRHQKVMNEDYEPQEVLSPMFGGPGIEKKQITARKNKSYTSSKSSVISPMFGQVSETKESIDEDLVNLSVDDMLQNYGQDETQVSLFDVMEEFDDEDK